jgi:hypothetical protein
MTRLRPFIRALREALAEGRALPPGTTRQWKNGTFVKTRDGKWVPAPSRKPPATSTSERTSREGLIDRIKAKGYDDDQAQMYLDSAGTAEPEQWAKWMAKFDLGPEEAEKVRQDLVRQEKDAARAHARDQWQAAEKTALNGQSMVSHEGEYDSDPPAGVEVEKGLDKVGRTLGGLVEKHPELKGLIAKGLVKRVVTVSNAGKPGHATASYNPISKQIEVGEPEHVHPSVLIHELGHAAEELQGEAGVDLSDDEWWGKDRPMASVYAHENPNEAFAEAFSAMLGKDREAFEKHAPEQAAAIRAIFKTLGRKEESMSIRPLIHALREAVATETREVWIATLKREAEGLDFNDPEDRVTFRVRVVQAVQHLKVSTLRELAADLGAKDVPASRDQAAKTLANAWMKSGGKTEALCTTAEPEPKRKKKGKTDPGMIKHADDAMRQDPTTATLVLP